MGEIAGVVGGGIQHGNSIRRTTSERKHYLPILKRYADDTSQSETCQSHMGWQRCALRST